MSCRAAQGTPKGRGMGRLFLSPISFDEQKKSVCLSGETDGFWQSAQKSAKIKTNS
jgi:hypothetical protein